MDIFLVVSLLILGIAIYIALSRISSRRKAINQRPNPSKTKVNLIIGDTPPPGGTVFNPDGTIGPMPDTPESRHKWTVQKMTFKIQQEPDDGEWYAERGKALMALGQYAEAIPDFSKLVELYPTWAGSYLLRGSCYFRAGDKEHALMDLRKYKELEASERLDKETVKILDELEEKSS